VTSDDLGKEYPAEPFAQLAAEVAQLVTIHGIQIALLAYRMAQPPNGEDARGMALFCEQFLLNYNNFNYNMHSNGEQWLLNKLAAFRPRVVFDVGANVGDWLEMASATLPEAQFHAFEIIESTFMTLAQRMAGRPGMVLNHCGLANHSGNVKMHVFHASSALSSYVAYPHGSHYEAFCPVKRGDEYAKDQGIERIDLLKIDVEGAEHLVLEGLDALLAGGGIDVIQFEYGMVNIITHFLLRDFYQFFESRDYLVGKLFPDHVDFRNYELEDEKFRGPNYVAVRKAQEHIINALSSP
jgi:FkbM family methyltransferase